MNKTIRLLIYGVIACTAFMYHCDKKYPDIKPGETRQGSILTQNGKTVPFIITVPEKGKAGGRLPVIITLHGYGSNAGAFHELWQPPAAAEGFILMTVRGDTPANEGLGFQWSHDGAEAVVRALRALQDVVPIDRKHIYLAGFSQGGTLAYNLLFQQPVMFSGAAVIGATPDSRMMIDYGGMLHEKRIYLAHGDQETGPGRVMQIITEYLKKYHITYKYKEYKDTGHSVPKPVEKEFHEILNFFNTAM